MTEPVTTIEAKPARRMVQLRYVLTPIAIIFTAVIILIIMGILAPKPAKKPIVVKAPLVEVITLNQQDVAFSIASQGSVMPRTETNLISEVSGNVVSVSNKFQVGGFFRKGEELMQIDDITYQVALLKAESQLESATAELEQEQARGAQAKEEWLLTGNKLEEAPKLALRTPQLHQARAAIKAAKADLKEAKTKLERTKILAPYDAMLKAKHVDIGQYVTVGSSIAATFAVDYAEIRLPVKQRDVAFLNLPKINQSEASGSSVELFYEVDGVKHGWQSKLTRYEGVVDMTSRVHYVVAQLDDPYGIVQGSNNSELRIGSFVNADITGKQVSDATAIPRSAVHGANTVYLVDSQNKLHIKEVNVLRAEVAFVYTLDVIDSDLRLIMTNIETPVEGMTVRVSGEEQQAEQVAGTDAEADKSGEEQGDKS
ncbi:efflux RND transporter periplasmic adaptor subunit [Thalassotalea atypica]|uniref:efflux RND transporter periplasmic adaptor subunit n=1 Tax=Thalassotalea atypica TaxID=2054316 RepID=UPI0025739C8C|nr:efflux RND transporter periplasmic adaptor subunit [Thalassotalea atypica]